MSKEKEVWKSVLGYEGCYEISSFGKVKSLSRKHARRNNSYTVQLKEIILKCSKDKDGYLFVGLHENGNTKRISIHQLVAIAFLNHTPCGMKLVVDHIDNNRINNYYKNLQLITCRENTSKDRKGYASKYVGVDLHKNQWRARININGKEHHLGYFGNELEASKVYQEKLKILGKKN